MNRSNTSADTRAAQAALTRPQDEDFDRHLLIDDCDDDTTLISTLVRERSPRELELLS